MDQLKNWHTNQIQYQNNLAEGSNVVGDQNMSTSDEQNQQQQVHPTANSIQGVGILAYIPPKEVIDSFPLCFSKYYMQNSQKLWPQGNVYTAGSHLALFATSVIEKKFLDQLVIEEHVKHYDKIQNEIKSLEEHIDGISKKWVAMNNAIATMLTEKGVQLKENNPTPDLSMLSENDQAAFLEYFQNLERLSAHVKKSQENLISEQHRRDFLGNYIQDIKDNSVYPASLYGNPRPLAICFLGDYVNGVHDPNKYVQDIVACNPGIGMKINFCTTGQMSYLSLPDHVSDLTDDILQQCQERVRIICSQYFAMKKQHQNDVVSRVVDATKDKKASGGYSHFTFRDLANNETIVTSAETDEEAKAQIMNSISGGLLNQNTSKKRQTRNDDHNDLDLNQEDYYDDNDENMSSKVDKTEEVAKNNANANLLLGTDKYNHQHQEYQVPILMKFPIVTLPCLQTTQGFLDTSNRPEFVLLTYIASHVAAFAMGIAANEAGLIAPISYSNSREELDRVVSYLQQDSTMSNLEFIVLQKGRTRVIPFSPALTSLHSEHRIKSHPLNDFDLKKSNNNSSMNDMP